MGAVLSYVLGWLQISGDKRRVHDAGLHHDALILPRYPPLGPNPDTPDPVTGMSPRQARAVLVTWDLLRPNIKIHGPQFFIQLFKTFPETQAQFKGFDKMQPDSLMHNAALIAHGSTFMNAVSNIIDNLGDTVVLAEILKTTGKNHKERGVQRKHFEFASEVLLTYLGDQLGTEWTPAAQEGWRLAMGAVNSVIFLAYDK